MTNQDFVKTLKDIAASKTVYMWGTFGSPVTETIIHQKVAQYPNRYSSGRQSHLHSLIGKGYFAFDCVGLIKGVLWGWNGDIGKSNGGAVYTSNGVPDTTASGIMNACKNVSTNISADMPVGSALYATDHIGIYAGDGKVIECTLGDLGDGVVITSLSARNWLKHGLLPYIDYVTDAPERKAEKGDRVKVKPGAKVYGKSYGLASFVYDDIWIVSQVKGDRAVIDKNASGTNRICSPVNVNDLIVQ